MTPEHPSDIRPVILGAGPAGLTAAYELTKSGITPVVLEKQDIVGGLSSTRTYKGLYFDMGGHRFFAITNHDEIDERSDRLRVVGLGTADDDERVVVIAVGGAKWNCGEVEQLQHARERQFVLKRDGEDVGG